MFPQQRKLGRNFENGRNVLDSSHADGKQADPIAGQTRDLLFHTGPRAFKSQGVYQIGEVQARSWTVRTWDSLQQPSNPEVIVDGSSQETLASTQIF